MTKDDVIRMAREADSGFEGGPDADGTMPDSLVGIEAITRFADLVSAHKQDELQAKIGQLEVENKLYKEAAVFFSKNQ